MFTGLIQGLGRIGSIDRSDEGARVTIETPLVAELRAGDSIAVNGVCLSAASLENGSFAADAMNETLSRTSLGDLAPGTEVNLELPLRAGDRLGGHVVQGHVDGVSLTVAGLDERSFTVSLIPDTVERTNLGRAAVGDRVNLEVDVLAKYVEKLIRR